MTKKVFSEFYVNIVKELGLRFAAEHEGFSFCDNESSLYEEYLNQKTILRILYNKEDSPEKMLLDRHKVCACMLAAIIKVRLLCSDIETDEGFELSSASRINEQLAFLSTWELFKRFVLLHGKEKALDYTLPKPFHNELFLDTVTRSLFMANQLNSLSTPLLANIFFLLEVYCNEKEEKEQLEANNKK